MGDTRQRRGLPEGGVNFRAGDDGRSSTRAGKRILADAVRDLDPALADRIRRESDWRHRYPQHFRDLTLVEAQSGAAALDVANRGLTAAYDEFVVVTDDGDLPLEKASVADRGHFETAEVIGQGARRRELVVPYQGDHLIGDSLLRQLDDWVKRGITEPSFAEVIGAVVRNPDWLDLSDRSFALVGAAAQMGPFKHLISWGARVAAIDTPRAEKWQRLIADVRSSAGRMLVPTKSDAPSGTELADIAGADLISQVAQLQDWLASGAGPLTMGNYGYVDGAGFVRLSMAFDALFTALNRVRDDLSLAYLATPSDVFLVPTDAVRMAQQRYRQPRPTLLAARLIHAVSRGKYLRPNYSGESRAEAGNFGLVNAFIVEQGPNYALAKRLQRWRMIAARADGILTSVHVAPPSRTHSVHKNPIMEQRQRLTARLGIETFDAQTSQAIAAAILVHDLRNPDAPANPQVPMGHPQEIFMFAANPGGRWRVPLEPPSSLPILRGLDSMRSGALRLVARGGPRTQ
jgi:hypothetical protein